MGKVHTSPSSSCIFSLISLNCFLFSPLILFFSSSLFFFSPPSVVCFDAKIGFDDNAQFRQREIFSQEDTSEGDPREVEATQHGLNYISMDGNIGCLGEPPSLVFPDCL